MIGYSGRHWRHSLCARAVTHFSNLSRGTRSIHGSSAARKHARNVRSAWGMGRASTCFLPCIGRVGRELFRPARPRQQSRHASSAPSCEGRAGRGWLARGAWRERSGRQTATRLAPPPPQHAPPAIFPLRSRAAQTADGDVLAGTLRSGLSAAPRGPPLLCVPEGVCGVAAVVQRGHARSLFIVGVRSGVLLERRGARALWTVPLDLCSRRRLRGGFL